MRGLLKRYRLAVGLSLGIHREQGDLRAVRHILALLVSVHLILDHPRLVLQVLGLRTFHHTTWVHRRVGIEGLGETNVVNTPLHAAMGFNASVVERKDVAVLRRVGEKSEDLMQKVGPPLVQALVQWEPAWAPHR